MHSNQCVIMDSKNYTKIVFRSFEAKNMFNIKQTFYHQNDVVSILKLKSSEYESIPLEFIKKSPDGHIGISKQGLECIEKYSKVPFNSNKYF